MRTGAIKLSYCYCCNRAANTPNKPEKQIVSCFSGLVDYIAFFAFIACATAGRARLQAISGHDLQANSGIAVQLQSAEPPYIHKGI
jgi:hypothetical protein